MRQSLDSEVLYNATLLREKLSLEDYSLPLFKTVNQRELIRIGGFELEELLIEAYGQKEHDKAVIITRSNKRANLFNQEVRKRILFKEFEVESGDRMMVVKNNYFWLKEGSEAGFIANGDMIEILRVRKTEECYGFRFADVTLKMLDYPDEPSYEAKIILDTINSETASLSHDQGRELYLGVLDDYQDIPERTRRNEKVRIDPYYNALQVKFGYALTCHKTQGGQWEKIFIDRIYLKDNIPDRDALRWYYTALTRATDTVYLIGHDDDIMQ
jgi:exodeoxyribonuclease-5